LVQVVESKGNNYLLLLDLDGEPSKVPESFLHSKLRAARIIFPTGVTGSGRVPASRHARED
jgi:hypothetical protein